MKHVCTALAILILLGSAAACHDRHGAAAPDSSSAGDSIGSIDFRTSASGEAQEHFLRGVAILHSFGYKQAREEFQKAQELDPDFAMAYWGETFCYNHPLLAERDLESPREVLARLGATPEERASKAPTQREKDFLAAVEVLFGEGEAGDRRIAYMGAMEGMYEAYPEDREVAAFYALSLLAAVGPMKDDTYRLSVRAGAIARDLFEENPNHPGAAHYTIHAFDDPVHAPLALEAAWRYSEIAPAVSHARHMPTHIFIQHGMWQQVSEQNVSAHQAAVDLWEPGDSVSDMVHALDWGHYGDLQRGDLEHARQWMETLDQVVIDSDGAARAVSTVPLLRARYIVETEQWETAPVTDESTRPELLATGLSAVVAGDLALAREAAARLDELGSETSSDRSTFQRGPAPARVAQREVAALIALAETEVETAMSLLDEGLELAEEMGPPRGSATPVKPIHELYGEVLLSLRRADEAIELFEASLLRTPNRPRSLLGLARAHSAAGNPAAAADAYRRLIEVREARAGLADVREAQEYLAET